MESAKIEQLREFVGLCKSDPSVLHRDPSLGFFRDYLRSLGAQLPSDTSKSDQKQQDADIDMPDKTFVADVDDDIVESDIEFDGDVIEPDNDPPQKMGDLSVEVTEESCEAAQIAKARAVDAVSEGRLSKAIDHLTEAISLNPGSAILYATRASIFLKMSKPNAAIRDADAALQINPDSAKGYKSRGLARAMIGQWQDAAKDLHLASNLDHDEEIALALKKVVPNAHKIEEHKRKYERLHKERDQKKGNQDLKDASRKEAMAALLDGNVISLHSVNELAAKFSAAETLSRLVVLYFTATWCGPCRLISPVYIELAKKHPEVVFLKVDIDELREAAAQYNINSVPTFFLLRNGKELDKVVGADKRELERKIALHASSM